MSPFLRSPSLLVLLCCLFCLPARAENLSKEAAADLLQRMGDHRARFPTLTADFTEEKTSRVLQKPLQSVGTLYFQAPNRFRRELRGASPSTTVSDGRQLWIYYPAFNEAERYPLGQRAMFDDAIQALTAGLNFQQVAEFYRYTASREGDDYRLVLTPKTGALRRLLRELQVWIAAEDYLIRKTVTLLAKDDRVVTTYRNQRATPLPANTFEYAPPPGTKISEPLGK